MINWFEQYYEELLKYAVGKVVSKKINVEATEIVNEAYIRFIDSGKDFDLSECKKIICDVSFEYLPEKMRQIAVGEKKIMSSPISSEETYRLYRYRNCGTRKEWIACNTCHEQKPPNAFYTQKFDGYYYTRITCKDCDGKIKLKWFAENRSKWAEYMKDRRRKDGILPRSKMTADEKYEATLKSLKKCFKKCYQKSKENLTDSYIKRIIKHKYPSPTQEQIQSKREQLQSKRRQQNALLNDSIKKVA